MSSSASEAACWIFGFGSLIQRPGFDFLERRPAVLAGHARRFWQASHDHRGTAERPGRVVTLIRAAGEDCAGVAYRIAAAQRETILGALEIREQDGYVRSQVQITLSDAGQSVVALTWIASPGNPSWIGPEGDGELAALIAARAGPSGTNADYLYELAGALRELGVHDAHVFDLENAVRACNYQPG